MNHIKINIVVFLASVLTLSSLAFSPGNVSAQPGNAGYAPPAAPSPVRYARAPYRSGFTFGVDLGLGSMTAKSGPIVCEGCDQEPVAVAGSFEVGLMLNPRLALLFHGRGTFRSLDVDGVNVLYNTMGLVAAKYWLTRQLWVKGGLGFAVLGITYDNGFVAEDQQLDEGGASMLAIGYEVLHARRFAIDLSLTGTESVFNALDDSIGTAVISLGATWF